MHEVSDRLTPFSVMMFSLDTSATPMCEGSVLLLRTKRGQVFPLEEFYSSIKSIINLLSHSTDYINTKSRFNWKWNPCSKFNLDNHISEIQSDGEVDADRLYFIVGTLFSRPMSLDQPLWSMALINNLSLEWTQANCAVVVRVHKALLAENSVIDWLSPLLINSIERKHIAYTSSDVNPQPTTIYQKLSFMSASSFEIARNVAEFGSEIFYGLVRSYLNKMNDSGQNDSRIFNAPISPFDGMAARIRTCRFSFIDMERINVLLSACGPVMFSELMLTIISGSLRYWVQNDHGVIEKSFVALVSGLNKINESQKDRIANLSLINLATLIEDPLERLAAIRTDRYNADQYLKRINVKEILASAPLLVARGFATIAKSLASNRWMKRSISNLTIHFEPDGYRDGFFQDGNIWVQQCAIPAIWPGNRLAFSIQSSKDTISIGLIGSGLTTDQLIILESGMMFSLHQIEKVVHRKKRCEISELFEPVCELGKLDTSLRMIEQLIGESTELSGMDSD